MDTITSAFLRRVKYLLPVFVLVLLSGLTPAAKADVLACDKRPSKPRIQTPFASASLSTRRADLGWKATECATRYNVEIRQGTTWGRPSDAKYNLTDPSYRTRKLERGRTYWWHVEACNSHGCKVSTWSSFAIMK